jgi:alpha-1,2-mannosyltransferase
MTTAQSALERRTHAWLVAALAFNLLLSLGIYGVLRANGEPSAAAIGKVGASHGMALANRVLEDSWYPMVLAYRLKAADRNADMYSLFFLGHIKWLYMPSSLLVLDLVPESAWSYQPKSAGETPSYLVELWMTWPSRLICLLAILASALIVEISLSRMNPEPLPRPRRRAVRMLVACALGLTFYPLVFSYELGQIQVFLNGFVALALLLRLLDRPIASGCMLALCALVKPQYGAVVLLVLFGGQWRLALGFISTFALGIGASIARFGWADHWRYLKVLSVIASGGETYWTNQSVNGLLNRFLGNGNPLVFVEDAYAPFRLAVYLPSLVVALGLLVLALWPTRRVPVNENGSVDRAYAATVMLASVIAATTIGAPVAWEHHYGSFLAIFALALPGLARLRPLDRYTGPLLLASYLAIANVMLAPELYFWNRWVGLLGSHLFFGSLGLFALLCTLRGDRWWSRSIKNTTS